ncbi:MAG: hypothetical protein ABW318_25295, partial [Vicinamibacterales bacterium]
TSIAEFGEVPVHADKGMSRILAPSVHSSVRFNNQMNSRTTRHSSDRPENSDANVGRPLAPGDEASAGTPGTVRRCAVAVPAAAG